MGLFTNRKDGGLIADVIRCDEPNYLIWKWHPNGDGIGKSVRANAIRWGSSIRVKDGEVAVFLYSGAPRPAEDFIVGPCDEILKTDNLPVISEMLGLAYNGKSPLQAEVYFINLSRVLQFPFVIPYFDVFDYRYPDFSVPIAIHGKVTYSICDYRKFVKLHRMVEIDQSTIQEQVKECVTQRIKSVVANTSEKYSIPLIQIDKATIQIATEAKEVIGDEFDQVYGLCLSALDITMIDIDKTNDGYQAIKTLTQDTYLQPIRTRQELDLQEMREKSRIDLKEYEELARIRVEEGQYAQRKATQTANLEAYKVEEQANIRKSEIGVAETIAKSGGFLAGFAVKGVFAGKQPKNTSESSASMSQKTAPPPVPATVYNIAVNGKAEGPFDVEVLIQMARNGDINELTLLWKPGMEKWSELSAFPELKEVIKAIPPAIE